MADDINPGVCEGMHPDSLTELCLRYCVHNPFIFCDECPDTRLLKIHRDIVLPAEMCEALVRMYQAEDIKLTNEILNVFSDTQHTCLRKLNLQNSDVTDDMFDALMHHPLLELDISECRHLGDRALEILKTRGHSLQRLYIKNKEERQLFNVFLNDDEIDNLEVELVEKYSFKLPNLQALAIHCISQAPRQLFYQSVVTASKGLSYLDLSGCAIELEDCAWLSQMKNLVTLILHDVYIQDIENVTQILVKLKLLRVLDLSCGDELPRLYSNAEQQLAFLVSNLPKLQCLDISGTNLAGFQKPKKRSHTLQPKSSGDDEDAECCIPGLEGRYLDFLGLLNCQHNPSSRKDIPAKKVTGDSNEDQIILSVQIYSDRVNFLNKALNSLFNLFRDPLCNRQKDALSGILTAMKKHREVRSIQISGSASLFYIAKSDESAEFSIAIRRQIISAILDGMEMHDTEPTMVRNGCLTLCQFRIPQDVKFNYERLVRVLLKVIPSTSEDFVQRISIYLLNSLACQVDGKEKQLIGDLGAIQVMLAIVKNKVDYGTTDEVLEVAWSTLWNVTDETASNCEKIITHGGLDLFINCRERFPNKPELLRNMMGLLGNIAEVKELRPCLMKSEYISVFSNLLMSTSDGIEVSYNACGVLAHIMSDGSEAWTVDSPNRDCVLRQMVYAMTGWKLRTKRNINYRSFEPILRLIQYYDTPEVQHWAVWALCNLTQMYPEKYCCLIENEGGLSLLRDLEADERPYKEIKELARQVLDVCTRFKSDPELVKAEAADEEVLHEEVQEDDDLMDE